MIAALAKMLASGASTDAQANAARALGILRGHDAVSALVEVAESAGADIEIARRTAFPAILRLRDRSYGKPIE